MASPKMNTAPVEVEQPSTAVPPSKPTASDNHKEADITPDHIEEVFKELKFLLGTVEKLQKAREEVGDLKPLFLRLLDGELLSGDELEQLKSGVNGLSKLIRLYSDYQTALEKAQPARALLDNALK